MIEEHFPYAIGALVFALAGNGMWVAAIFVGALALMASPLIYARDAIDEDEYDGRAHPVPRHHHDD